jgi:hypothetical protein
VFYLNRGALVCAAFTGAIAAVSPVLAHMHNDGSVAHSGSRTMVMLTSLALVAVTLIPLRLGLQSAQVKVRAVDAIDDCLGTPLKLRPPAKPDKHQRRKVKAEALARATLFIERAANRFDLVAPIGLPTPRATLLRGCARKLREFQTQVDCLQTSLPDHITRALKDAAVVLAEPAHPRIYDSIADDRPAFDRTGQPLAYLSTKPAGRVATSMERAVHRFEQTHRLVKAAGFLIAIGVLIALIVWGHASITALAAPLSW